MDLIMQVADVDKDGKISLKDFATIGSWAPPREVATEAIRKLMVRNLIVMFACVPTSQTLLQPSLFMAWHAGRCAVVMSGAHVCWTCELSMVRGPAKLGSGWLHDRLCCGCFHSKT